MDGKERNFLLDKNPAKSSEKLLCLSGQHPTKYGLQEYRPYY